MLTIEEIRAMSDEELAAANAAMGRRLLKTIFIKAAVTVAVVVAVSVIVNKLVDTDIEEEADSTEN